MKDANECTATNKDEHFASLLALLRSATAFQFNSNFKEPTGTKLKGNQFVTSGCRGERIVKKTGETKTNEARANIHQGARYISYAINETLLRCKKLEKLSTSESERKRIKQHISKKDNQFMANRNSETLTKYGDSPLTSAPALNAI